jgi:hypothetical protein
VESGQDDPFVDIIGRGKMFLKIIFSAAWMRLFLMLDCRNVNRHNRQYNGKKQQWITFLSPIIKEKSQKKF